MARQYCSHCSKPRIACICRYLSLQDNDIAVIILQHLDEKNKAIGTANLVALGLSRSCVISAIDVPEAEFKHKMAELGCTAPLLVYPSSLAEESCHYVLDFETEHSTPISLKNKYDAIIVLDGTWRNTRELIHRNEWLKLLPTAQLLHAGASQYRIRHAQKEGALATIEAVASMLTLLEVDFQSEKLLAPFEQLIEFQIKKMGQDVYQKNYLTNNNDMK